jgi:hypothetical protein
MDGKPEKEEAEPVATRAGGKPPYLCDRCGCEMVEMNCKVVCPNCGSRFDCSDLNIYFD